MEDDFDYEPDLDFGFECDSAFASVGWGTDEDYGYFGDPEFYGEEGLMGERVVAEVYHDGALHDVCFTWEAGQVYANEGYRVVAVADDGSMTVTRAQTLYEAERSAAADCFGPGVRTEA